MRRIEVMHTLERSTVSLGISVLDEMMQANARGGREECALQEGTNRVSYPPKQMLIVA